ncbi:MAG: TPR end-of-group domain-containing protein [Phycisphaerales bacterium]
MTRLPLALACAALVAVPALAFPPPTAQRAGELMREKKYGESIAEYEAYLKANRFDGSAWSNYAYAQHMGADLEGSIKSGQRALMLGYRPESESYNIACAYALLGKTDQAIEWLQKAFESRFAEQQTLESDDDLNSLRKDPRFIALTGLNPPEEADGAKRWAWDLDFLARRMKQMHWDLYANVPKDKFLAEIDAIKQAAATGVSEDRLRVRISRLLAMVGDGHTTMAAYADGEKSLNRIPLHLWSFPDGIYVLGAPEDMKELVGGKIVKVGSMSADDAAAKLRQFCSVDNDMGYLYSVPARMLQPAALQEIGATGEGDIEYTFRFADGNEKAAKIAARPMQRDGFGKSRLYRSGYVYANAASKTPAPLFQQDLEKPLTLKYLEDQRAVYFGFQAVSGNEDEPFKHVIESMNSLIEEKSPEFLIIDMRFNGGGNTGLVAPFIESVIRNAKLNQPGKLFVIIGRNTFSAAQNTVNMLEKFTNATFVGEPTGSRPAFVGESTYVLLPYSKLRVHCSSRYWQILDSTDRRTWVQPQIAAEWTFKDFVENRDPCMEAIKAQIGAATHASASASK